MPQKDKDENISINILKEEEEPSSNVGNSQNKENDINENNVLSNWKYYW